MRSDYVNFLLVCLKQELLGRSGQNSCLNKMFNWAGHKFSTEAAQAGQFLWMSSLDFFSSTLYEKKADHLFPSHSTVSPSCTLPYGNSSAQPAPPSAALLNPSTVAPNQPSKHLQGFLPAWVSHLSRSSARTEGRGGGKQQKQPCSLTTGASCWGSSAGACHLVLLELFVI